MSDLHQEPVKEAEPIQIETG